MIFEQYKIVKIDLNESCSRALFAFTAFNILSEFNENNLLLIYNILFLMIFFILLNYVIYLD